jgi:restriction endonuclease S subunit
MKIGVVNTKSFMTSGYRFDPDIHLSEGAAVRKQLRNLPYELTTVGKCASSIFLGNIFSRIFVKDIAHGVPYLAASDTVLSNIETGRFLAKKQANELSYLMLKKDWILITCSGTLGNVTYTNSTFENHIATHDLIRVVPNDVNVNKGTLYAFLAGKYGYYQITQSQFGGVVKHINDSQASSIIVPILPEQLQKDVNTLIQEAATLREEATAAFDNAHVLIETQFAKKKTRKIAAVNAANVLSASMKRFDASYHLSDSIEYEKMISSMEYMTLSDLCYEIAGAGRAKRNYTDNISKGVPFLSNSDLGRANPLQSCKYALKSRTVDLNSYLKYGMIVTGRVGAIGQTQFIGKEYEQLHVLASDNVIRIVPKCNNGYIFAFLSSKIGNSLFWKYSTGGVQPFVTTAMVGQIVIPILDSDIIETCNSLIDEYSKKREMSNILEYKAIRMVEQEIEKWSD